MYKVILNIHRKQKSKYQFNANLSLYLDKNYDIQDVKIKIYLANINYFTTPSWYEANNINWKKRKYFFKKLNINNGEQLLSKSFQHKNQIEFLSKNQCELLSNLYNVRDDELKINTINTFSVLLTGSNPTGAKKDPAKAEFIMNCKDNYNYNFMLVLDKLFRKNKVLVPYDKFSYYEKISFEKWRYENQRINILFKIANKESNNSKYKSVEEYLDAQDKQFNQWMPAIKSDIQKHRQLFVKNINKMTNNIKEAIFNSPLGLNDQRAHIKEVKTIKNELFTHIYNNHLNDNFRHEYDEILLQISDTKNYLPLDPGIHTLFDNDKIYWDIKGNLKIIDNNIKQEWNNDKDKEKYYSRYLKINNQYLPEKENYIRERINEIHKRRSL